MERIDFTNHQNREVRVEDVTTTYLNDLRRCAKTDPWYPCIHIAPPHGLLNDPNGLCQINGVYHIYFQWFPLGPVHGLKHWYHISTKDFVSYEVHGCALIPEHKHDAFGCFTGMTLQDGDDHFVYYTGIDEHHKANVSFATMDKEGRLLKEGEILSLDHNLTTENFRDPFVWKQDHQYYMLIGGEKPDHTGALLMYQGDTKKTFQYRGYLNMLNYPFGYMLECPNYIEMNEKGCLIFSPQGIVSTNKYDYRNVFSVVYMIGSSIDNMTFDATDFYELDKGFDFYAPQVFGDETGRHILYGWLGNSKCEYPSDVNQWAHMLTLPRKLEMKDNILYQTPLPEYNNLRMQKIRVEESLSLEHCGYEIEIENDEPFELCIQNAQGEFISFQMSEQEYILDRTHMSCVYNELYGTVRYAKRYLTKHNKTTIYLDTSSIEIFVDEGRTTMTSRYFIKGSLTLKLKQTSATIWKLASIDVPYPDKFSLIQHD